MTDFLALLTGVWHLQRSIDGGGSMTGTATIARCDSRAFDYREQGRLVLPGGQILDAARRYIFQNEDDGFSVLFAENPPRLFHRIVLGPAGASLAGTGHHLCGDDRYETHYEFRADNSFGVRHAVSGPRKRYVMVTDYTRANPA